MRDVGLQVSPLSSPCWSMGHGTLLGHNQRYTDEQWRTVTRHYVKNFESPTSNTDVLHRVLQWNRTEGGVEEREREKRELGNAPCHSIEHSIT